MKQPASGVEGDAPGRIGEVHEAYVGCCQGGVAAEIDLDGRRKPADAVRFAVGMDESGFGEVVFGGDGLHQRIVERLLCDDDGGGVAAEEAVGKGIDVVDGELHNGFLERV